MNDAQEWRQWPSMAPFIHGQPMSLDDGGESAPNSISTVHNLEVISHWFHELQAERTLETGLGFGASATLFAELHRQRRAGGRHHAIDPFQKANWKSAALRHISESGLDGWFEHHDAPSDQVLPRMQGQGMRYDMIYVDGSHLFEDVFVDFHFASQLIRDGGLILLDDSTSPHVAKVVRFIRANLMSSFEEHSPYEVTRPEWGVLKRWAARVAMWQQLTLFRKTGGVVRDWNVPLRDF